MRLTLTLGLCAASISLSLSGVALAQPQDAPRTDAPRKESKKQPWKQARGTFSFEGLKASVEVDRAEGRAEVALAKPGERAATPQTLTLSPDLIQQLDLAISRAQVVRWAPILPTSKEALIKRLQAKLAAKGYATEPSGAFDEATQAAVEKFQKDQFLEVKGWADEATRKRLGIFPAGGGFEVDSKSVRGRRIEGVLGVIARSAQLGREPIRHQVSGRVLPTSGREVELRPAGSEQGLVVGFLHAGYEKATSLLREGTFELLTWKGEREGQDRHLIARIYVEATPESQPQDAALGQPLEVVALAEVPTRTLDSDSARGLRTVGGAALVVRDAEGRKGRIDHPAALRSTRLPGATSALTGLGKIR
tara:strand:+ start:942 stop:2033 length:1092 start_codon:yes stop_codon:yes gene_type:complete